MSSAPSRSSHSTPSACGTRTSRRRPTKRSATCSRVPREKGRRIKHESARRRYPEERKAMQCTTDSTLIDTVRERAHPLTGATQDYDPLMDLVGDARFVLLGEASHGTHDFYHERAQITQRLIEEKGFTAVAAEADWPDTDRVNR